ncbi:MAG: peptidylprolyl isomerase, partial [Bacteroidia bacterium]|nr:peptidylprolyl isomerase [Bacteroidia bacterium]
GSSVTDVIEEDLGFFSTLNMVAPFEDAAYNTTVGEISPIVRSQFGYHIIQVKETKPFRQIQVAHIMRATPDTVKAPIPADVHLMDSLLNCIRTGEDFESLAKRYSTDHQSAHYGGKMPWLFEDAYIPGFMEAVLSLKRDEVSDVVKSPFGLHIIKMLDERSSIPAEQMSHIFADLLKKSKVASLSSTAIASRTAKRYKAQINESALCDIVGIVLSKSKADEKKRLLAEYKTPIVSLSSGDKLYASDANIPIAIPSNQTPAEFKSAIIDRALCEYYKRMLPIEDMNYKYTLAEYLDGPLVYEMNIQHVWGKQSNDSTIMDELYAANPSRYSKGGKFSGHIYVCDNSRDAEKVRKAIERGKSVDKKLYVELIEGDQEQGGLYDDYLWPYMKSNCIVVDGTYTEGQHLDRQLANQQLQVDLITYREREYAQKLRHKYHVESNPRL